MCCVLCPEARLESSTKEGRINRLTREESLHTGCLDWGPDCSVNSQQNRIKIQYGSSLRKRGLATCDLSKPPRVTKTVTEKTGICLVWTWMLGPEENLVISRPYPKPFQREGWAFALLTHDWLILYCRSKVFLNLPATSKKPQTFKIKD